LSLPGNSASPKLLDRLAAELRLPHYSPLTTRAYVGWARRFILFHERRHPRELSAEHVEPFLNDLVARSVSASTHQQALCALAFLYQRVLRLRPSWMRTTGATAPP
jgi:hypothetical protein